MWQYVIGGATIFGLIVGFFSVYNGRATRRYIGELIKETRQSTEKELKRTQELLEKHGSILEKLADQHTTMINLLKTS